MDESPLLMNQIIISLKKLMIRILSKNNGLKHDLSPKKSQDVIHHFNLTRHSSIHFIIVYNFFSKLERDTN